MTSYTIRLARLLQDQAQGEVNTDLLRELYDTSNALSQMSEDLAHSFRARHQDVVDVQEMQAKMIGALSNILE